MGRPTALQYQRRRNFGLPTPEVTSESLSTQHLSSHYQRGIECQVQSYLPSLSLKVSPKPACMDFMAGEYGSQPYPTDPKKKGGCQQEAVMTQTSDIHTHTHSSCLSFGQFRVPSGERVIHFGTIPERTIPHISLRSSSVCQASSNMIHNHSLEWFTHGYVLPLTQFACASLHDGVSGYPPRIRFPLCGSHQYPLLRSPPSNFSILVMYLVHQAFTSMARFVQE